MVTIVIANPRALPTNFLKRTLPRFKKIMEWPAGAKIFAVHTKDKTKKKATPSVVQVSSQHPTWALLFEGTGPPSPTPARSPNHETPASAAKKGPGNRPRSL